VASVRAYVPSKLIVSGDATATANNIHALGSLFRWGFRRLPRRKPTCDIALALILYVLLRPVSKGLALLAAFFGLVGTAEFAAAEIFYLAPSLILGGAGYLKTFSPDQLNTLALLSLKLFAYGGAMFTVFYGVGWVLRGYLIFRIGLSSQVSRRSYDARWSSRLSRGTSCWSSRRCTHPAACFC